MYELFTFSLEAEDTTYLKKSLGLPEGLLYKEEVERVQEIVDYERRHGQPPSLKWACDNTGLMPWSFSPSPEEPKRPPLSETYERFIEKRLKEVTDKLLRQAGGSKAPIDKAEVDDILAKLNRIRSLVTEDGNELVDREYFREAPAVPPELVDGFIEMSSLNLLFAPAKTGKTFLAYHLGYALAAGHDDWLDMAVLDSGPTLILDYEMGPIGASGRIKQVAKGFGDDLSDESVTLPAIDLYCHPKASLTSPAGALWLEEKILEHGSKFVVIDSLNKMLPGVNMNQVSEYSQHFTRLSAVAAKTGACILITHWPAATTGEATGGEVLYGAFDHVIKLERAKKNWTELTIESHRSRYPRGFEEVVCLSTRKTDKEKFALNILPGGSMGIVVDELPGLEELDDKPEKPFKKGRKPAAKVTKAQEKGAQNIALLKVLAEHDGLSQTEWTELGAGATSLPEPTVKNRIYKVLRKSPKWQVYFEQGEDNLYRVTSTYLEFPPESWGQGESDD